MPSPSLTLLRTQSDARLIGLARAGHERAFEAIVERYRRPLLAAARRVLPEGRAEDALQQALLSAWTALQRGDDVRELRPWLYRIVHNTSLNALRASGYDYDELHDAMRIAHAGEDELERRAVMRQTLASLAALPERQREALLRTAVTGDSQEEVARDLGLTDNGLRQLVHRARVSMRAALTALTPLPLVTAAAAGTSRGGPLVERIAELTAGGGASVTLAKAGTVVVLAGSAISGPAVVERVADRPPHGPATAAAATKATPEPGRARPRAAASEPEPVRAVVPVATRRRAPTSQPARTQRRTAHRQTRRERQSGDGGEREHQVEIGDAEPRDDEPEQDRHGSGGGEDDSGGTGDHAARTPEPDESEDDSGDDGEGGSGGALPAATMTPEPVELDDDHESEHDSHSSGPRDSSNDESE